MMRDQLSKYVQAWDKRMMSALGRPANQGVYTSYLNRGTLLSPPASPSEVSEKLLSISNPFPQDLMEFYCTTNGVLLPCMDAEDGRILEIHEIVPLATANLPFSYPTNSWEGKDTFTSVAAQRSWLLTDLIDSAFYAWENTGNGSFFWALFHHGDDLRFGSFEELFRNQTTEILRHLEINP